MSRKLASKSEINPHLGHLTAITGHELTGELRSITPLLITGDCSCNNMGTFSIFDDKVLNVTIYTSLGNRALLSI